MEKNDNAPDVTLESLSELTQQLKNKIADMEKENSSLKSQIAKVAGEELKQNEEAPKFVLPVDPVSHKEKKYKVMAGGIRILGSDGSPEEITAQELVADPKLIEKVLKIEGQGILKLLK